MAARARNLAMAPGGATPAKRARRRRQRQRRRMRNREAYELVGRIADPSIGNLPGLAPMRSAVDGGYGSDEAVPSVNYQPALPALIKRGGTAESLLATLGSTRAGQMWALKALHPNGEEVTASAGIPDHTNVPVITPEFRSNFTISGVGTSASSNEDVDLVVLPSTDLAFMYRRYQAGANPAPNVGWQFVYYPALQSGVADFVFERHSDKTEQTLEYYLSRFRDYGKSRAMYSGLTAHLDAPTLADQGRVVATQVPLEMRVGPLQSGAYVKAKTDAPTDSTVTGSPINFLTLPTGFPYDESMLFQLSPGTVVWEAREGVYVPSRFREPVHLFEADAAETLYGVAIPSSIPEGIATHSIVGRIASGVWANLSVGVPNNMLATIVLFRGIDARANINVKTRIGVESLVEGVTEVAPFQHASPVLDRAAIDMVTKLSQTTPMAYPANYNDFSSILGVLKNVVGTFVRPISGALEGLGIPVVSDIAGGISSILGHIGMSGRNRNRRRNAFSRAARRL